MLAGMILTCLISPADDGPATAAPRVMAMIDAVVEKHIDPPARQELVRLFCRELTKHQAPGLAREISKARTDDALIRLLEEHLRDAGEVNVNDCLHRALLDLRMPGMVTRSADSKVNKQVAENRYVGTGIQLAMTPRPVMQKVFRNGPAHKVGAKDGDIIVTIDGESTKGMGIRDVVERLRGPIGSEVQVTLQQPAAGAEPRDYTIVRGIVPLTTIGEPKVTGTKIAVRLESIGSSTVHELRKLESELSEDMTHIELDFRSLSNHHLHHARLLANALLDENPLGTTQSQKGDVKYITEPGCLFEGLRLTILVDQRTAGTPEWIAAAVQSAERGNIKGRPTAGAGFVIESVRFDDETTLELPVARLRSASGILLIAKSQHASAVVSPLQRMLHNLDRVIPDELVSTRTPTPQFRQPPRATPSR